MLDRYRAWRDQQFPTRAKRVLWGGFIALVVISALFNFESLLFWAEDFPFIAWLLEDFEKKAVDNKVGTKICPEHGDSNEQQVSKEALAPTPILPASQKPKSINLKDIVKAYRQERRAREAGYVSAIGNRQKRFG